MISLHTLENEAQQRRLGMAQNKVIKLNSHLLALLNDRWYYGFTVAGCSAVISPEFISFLGIPAIMGASHPLCLLSLPALRVGKGSRRSGERKLLMPSFLDAIGQVHEAIGQPQDWLVAKQNM